MKTQFVRSTAPNRRAFLAGTAAAAIVSSKNVNAAETPVTIQSFGLTNWKSNGTSAGFARQGVIFKKGDIPAGSSVEVRRKNAPIPAQFDERSTWSDGSLKFAVMHLRDTVFAASEARIYDLVRTPGAAFQNAPTTTIADITTRHRFAIGFPNHRQSSDGKTFETLGSGVLAADFATHMSIPTRVEMHHAGAVCDGWTGWGMATDVGNQTPDAHLKVNWHADIWKNADGTIYSIEIGAEPAQDWWSVPNKTLRSYDAFLVDTFLTGSASIIGGYKTVIHPYKSRWLTVQNAGGNNRGRRHWVGGACPTLTYLPNRAYWIASGLVPPLNLASKPAAYASFEPNTTTYVPCSNHSHRNQIDGTGGYEGRGIIGNCDGIAFLRQTAEDVACARINAHVGLHVFYHYRSNRPRRRPGDSAPDTANTPISMIMGLSRGTAPSYDFTADGMPAPVHAYADNRTTPQGRDGYVEPAGGGGVWSVTTGDSSHAVNYSYFMYLLEGERYHLEATLDLATNLVHQGIDNVYSNRPQSPMARSGFGRSIKAPDTVYDAIAGLNGQERSAGWSLGILGSAAGIVPDRHVAARFIKRLNQQQSIYMRDILAYQPADAKAAGVSPFTDELGLSSPWMGAFNTLGGYHNWLLTESAEARAWADMTANMSIGMVESNIFKTLAYRANSKQRGAPYDTATNRYLPRTETRIRFAEDGSAYTGLLDVKTGGLSMKPTVPLTEGDVFYVEEVNGSGDPQEPPPDLKPGVPYYAVQVRGDAFKLSASPNGQPVTVSVSHWAELSCDPKRPFDPLKTPPPANLGVDSYVAIHRAALVMAHRCSHPDATALVVKKIQAFTARLNSSKYVNWDYAELQPTSSAG
jgi:hypothetical protein